MARASKTGGKASRAKPLKTKGIKKATTIKSDKAKSANTERRIVPVAKMPKHHSIAGLTKELKEAREQQAATAEILKVINSSAGNLTPVFEIILEKAHRLCDVTIGSLELLDGDFASTMASRGFNEQWEQWTRRYKVSELTRPGYLAAQHTHIIDMKKLVAQFPNEAAMRAFVEVGGLRTFLDLKLVKDGVAFGRIIAARHEVRPFTDKQIALLQSFADQAVIAIENARMFNETKEALERQTATSEVLQVISSSVSDTLPVFEKILDSCQNLIACTDLAVLTVESDNLVHLGSTRGSWGLLAAKNFKPTPIDKTIIAQAVAELRTIHVPDSLHGDDVSDVMRRVAQRVGQSFSCLIAPMKWQGRGVGALFISRVLGTPFTQNEISLFETFADQAVIAIQNARLFNETKEALERQTATADILRVISGSPTDVQPVFQAIAEHARLLCKAQVGGTTRLEGDMVHLAGVRSMSADAEKAMRISFPMPLKLAPPNIRRAIVEQVPIQIPDVHLDSDYVDLVDRTQRMGFRSIMSVPLMHEGRSIGTIGVAREEPGLFPATAVSLLQTFADQAVIAIENVRLFNETKEALERQTATADILKVIASSPSDVQPVFDAIAERSKRLVDALSTTVFRLEDGVMHLKAFTPTNPEADATLKAMFPAPLSGFSWSEAIGNGEIHRVLDTELEFDSLRELARLRGFRSMLFVPLLRDRKPIGVIAVTRVEPGPFVEHHVQLLQTFADQAVIAIQNARLFNETKEALEQQTATADILKVIASSPNDVQPVFQAIADRSNRLVNGLSTAVCIKIDDMVHLAAFTATNAAADAALKATFPVPISAVNFMILVERGEIYRIPDTEDVEQVRDIARLRGYRSMLFVPLMRDGELIGVISQTRRDPGPFNDNHVQLLLTFADQAVIAISNVRLFREVQERTRELSTSLDELRGAQDRLVQTEKLASLGQLTAGIAHEIKNPLNFVNNFSALSVELIAELREALGSVQTSDENRKEIDELAAMLTSNVEKIESHGKRADSIVKNMLLHSRDSTGEHRLVDINAILEESLNLAYHGARAEKSGFNITLKRDLDPKAGMVDLYPQEITRVFLNLITNGFYAASKRKATTTAMDFEPALSVATKDIGNAVEIRIRDNGTGIPDDVKEKMFNPFFTTKPAGEGTGLGLSMSHDIVVKQHRGRIDVETQPDAFTEFLIVLPRLGAAPENQESKP